MDDLTMENLAERFEKAKYNDPIVYRCLMHCAHGFITFEEALQMAIVIMTEDRTRLMDIIKTEMNRSVRFRRYEGE